MGVPQREETLNMKMLREDMPVCFKNSRTTGWLQKEMRARWELCQKRKRDPEGLCRPLQGVGTLRNGKNLKGF